MGRDIKNCQFCTYSSDHTSHLKRHIKFVHLDIRNQCGYKGASRSKLKRHKESIHDKEANDLECNQCEFVSSTRNQLNRHKMTIHNEANDITKYLSNKTCIWELENGDSCGKMFSWPSNVKRAHKCCPLEYSKVCM